MSNAGKIYRPSGSFKVGTGAAERIDPDKAIIREIREETGLQVARKQLGPMLVIEAGSQVVIVTRVQLAQSGVEIIAEINAHLQNQTSPEISDIVAVRWRQDIQLGAMPEFTVAYIEYAFGA